MRYCKLLLALSLTLSATTQAQQSVPLVDSISEEQKELAKSIADAEQTRAKSDIAINSPKLTKQTALTSNQTEIVNEIAEGQVRKREDAKRDASQTIAAGKANTVEITDKDKTTALATPDYARFGTGGEYGANDDFSRSMAEARAEASEMKETRYGDDVYAYIAVSMSMPARWFRTMLASLANEHKDKRVIIALQGAQPGDFARLALALEQAMPDTQEGSYSLVIDPTIFMRLEVTRVPTFVINTDTGWRKVLGEMSLSQASAYAKQDYDTFEALGKTYPIAEPNLITLLQEKMREQLEEQDPVKAMQAKASGSQPAIVSLPLAEEAYQYTVSPQYTVQQDMTFQGVNFAKKGDTVNPLDKLPLQESYAFVDLTEPTHIEQLKRWQSEFTNLRVFSTTLPPAISQINSLMVERFGIERIPSIAYQEGNQLHIEVEKHEQDMQEVHYAE